MDRRISEIDHVIADLDTPRTQQGLTDGTMVRLRIRDGVLATLRVVEITEEASAAIAGVSGRDDRVLTERCAKQLNATGAWRRILNRGIAAAGAARSAYWSGTPWFSKSARKRRRVLSQR